MSDEQWTQAKHLLDRLIDADADDPVTWLDDQCGDPDLRAEVTSLLDAYHDGTLSPGDDAAGWVDEDAALDRSDADAEPLAGRRVGDYRLVEAIGTGGAGVVYRAERTAPDDEGADVEQTVAVKLLRRRVHSGEAARRFRAERQVLASLDHPHIAALLDGGVTDSEHPGSEWDTCRPYLVMEHVDGVPITDYADAHNLPLSDRLDLLDQVLRAVEAAHQQGVVHRDLKPSNVFVTDTADGTPRVTLLDFGIAKLLDDSMPVTRPQTRTGRLVMTPEYAAPEQVAGGAVTPQTDLYQLGALLYELLAGARPFDDVPDSALLHAIQHEEPTPLRERAPAVPPEIARITEHCLRKDPEERPDSAAALAEALRTWPSAVASSSTETRPDRPDRPDAPQDDRPPPDTPPDPETEIRRPIAAAGLAVAVVLAAAVGWALWPRSGPAPAQERTVAVLPFEVTGSGTDAWRDGMVTLLSVGLDGAAGLRVVADRTVFAAWEERGADGTAATAEEALSVARDVGAEYAVLGSAVGVGGTLRLSAEVRRTATGKEVGRVQVQGARDSATVLANGLSRRVLDVLFDESEDRIPSTDLSRVTTGSLAALKAYLAGERHFRSGRYQAAIDDFEAAIGRDSTFALAYVRLGITKAWVGERAGIGPALRRAHRLADQLPRREQQLVETAYMYNVQNRWKEGVDTLRRLTRLYPDDPTIWYYLGETLIYASVPGGLPESERAFEEAARLDPGVTPYRHKLAQLALALHRDSARTARRIDRLPDGPRKRWYQTVWTLNYGPPGRKQEAWARIETLPRDSVFTWPTIPMSLFPPTAWAVEDRVLRILSQREDIGPVFRDNWALHKLKGGRLRAALAEAPDLPRVHREMAEHRTLGVPVPDSLLCPRGSHARLDPSPALWQLQCVGLSLIEQGREEELSSVLGHIRRRAERSSPSPGIESHAALMRRSLKGYRAYRADSLQVAAEHWEGFNASGDEGALWRGDLYRKLGRPHEAKGWYRAAWSHPLAHERLGRLFETMGRPRKAAAAYERFVAAWAGADPALQPRVDRARDRLRALPSPPPDGEDDSPRSSSQ